MVQVQRVAWAKSYGLDTVGSGDGAHPTVAAMGSIVACSEAVVKKGRWVKEGN